MSIRDLLAKHKPTQQTGNDYIDRIVFKNALLDLGVETETISDCLLEAPDKWEGYLKYFEAKYEQDRR